MVAKRTVPFRATWSGSTVSAVSTAPNVVFSSGAGQATHLGRFEGATGAYDFHIVACPGAFGFDSTATIDGWISRP